MEIKDMVIVIICVVAVALTLLALGNNMGVEYTQMSTAVASVCVPIAFFGIVLFALFDSKAPTGMCVLAGGFAGIIFAYILFQLNSQGIFVDSLIANLGYGATITDLMAVTVILWLLIGILFEVTRKK